MSTPEQVAAWFTDTHPIGTPVTYYPSDRHGRALTGETRSGAWVVSGTPVVLVTGCAGGIALSHVVCAEHVDHAIGEAGA